MGHSGTPKPVFRIKVFAFLKYLIRKKRDRKIYPLPILGKNYNYILSFDDFICQLSIYAVKTIYKISNYIIDMLGTDGETDGIGLNTLINKLFFGELAVSGGSGVNDKALNIGNIGKQREYLQTIDELVRFFHAPLNLKGEDRTAAVREVFLIQRIIGMICKRRMIYLLDLWMICKEFNNLLCILSMALKTK